MKTAVWRQKHFADADAALEQAADYLISRGGQA